jgi:hypothetical protein
MPKRSCSVSAPAASVDIAFDESLGLVLAADVVARERVPPFDNSAVDGYAVPPTCTRCLSNWRSSTRRRRRERSGAVGGERSGS